MEVIRMSDKAEKSFVIVSIDTMMKIFNSYPEEIITIYDYIREQYIEIKVNTCTKCHGRLEIKV